MKRETKSFIKKVFDLQKNIDEAELRYRNILDEKCKCISDTTNKYLAICTDIYKEKVGCKYVTYFKRCVYEKYFSVYIFFSNSESFKNSKDTNFKIPSVNSDLKETLGLEISTRIESNEMKVCVRTLPLNPNSKEFEFDDLQSEEIINFIVNTWNEMISRKCSEKEILLKRIEKLHLQLDSVEKKLAKLD